MRTLLAFALFIVTCGSALQTRAGEQPFKSQLLDAIHAADRIVVTEHSLATDLPDPKTRRPLSENEIVYGSRELDAKEKQSFATIISKPDEDITGRQSLCIFAPHHTIRFYSHDENFSVMNICFGCGQVQWNEGVVFNPHWLVPSLAAFVQQIGFQPRRDWQSLAETHAQ